MKKYEYVWLDGYQPEPYLRSKVKVTTDRTPPEWSFDGSSTQQADTEGSDCILIPVQEYKNPLFGDSLVMCGVQTSAREAHSTNRDILPLKSLLMNGGLVLNRNIFLQIQMVQF